MNVIGHESPPTDCRGGCMAESCLIPAVNIRPNTTHKTTQHLFKVNIQSQHFTSVNMETLAVILLCSALVGQIAGDEISPEEEKVSGREGESVTLRCEYQTNNDYVYLYWYRHHSDLQAPQFILWKGARSQSNEENIPDNRYGSKTTRTTTELTINRLTLADSALYYCALGRRWGPFLIFGKPITLSIEPKDTTPVKPTLFVLSPLQPKVGWEVPPDRLGPEVCLATSFRPKEGQMVLNVREGPVTLNTNSAVLSMKQSTYFYAGFTNQTIYSCELNNRSSNNDNIDLCTDVHPENAKLNYYLLVMNGVRVLLTKTVAFSTLLTLRAMLF